ncbi:GGDEF domain-containing protein [Psychrobacillus sp. Sa2BUA9]|uniref:GGDEF domain-containing protein n=1 Tax=Psychrobacillus faecigallinarum TaxID=2762235 RepID=A0ABR8R980_9BACI|nr:sensor domain-containing diguanylate cyclase [Psychrobacillus faecigallinarum]MBD7944305.1 GGDEF domain-containing protein [Psychrobacillus faecigallinarum]
MIKTLRFWILTLISFTIIGILTSSLFSSYLVTKNSLIENSLEQNQVYSKKLAQMSEELFASMQLNLEGRKADIIKLLDQPEELTVVLDQLIVTSRNFNSVSVIDKNGLAIATSPNVGIAGNIIESEGVREALDKKENIITKPYMASTGRLLILVSTPLFNEQNEYLGMLNGTIYLEEDNFIRNILAEHYSKDGSYVYVVDHSGTLIYHPDEERIGEVVKSNEVVEKLIKGNSGSSLTENTKGDLYLAGYSFIEASNWGVVSQTPYQSSLEPLIGIILKIFLYALPFVALFLVVAFIISNKLAFPLQKLAMYTMNKGFNKKELRIPTWYFEAKQLTETVEEYRRHQEETVADFKMQSLTDPLTGLKNRRFAEYLYSNLIEEKQYFSMLMVDIDFFKKVNDEFGHNAGDEVLQFLASRMNLVASDNDFCIRLGGEEFAIVFPNTHLDEAYRLAEILRKDIETTLPPTRKLITISAGVGEYVDFNEPITSFIERIDRALYKAKSNGRNNTMKSN